MGVSLGYIYWQQDAGGTELSGDGWYGELHGGADFFVSRSAAVRFTWTWRHEELEREISMFGPFGFRIFPVEETRDDVALVAGLAFFLKAGG